MLVFEALARTLQRSRVWGQMEALIEAEGTSDEARLDPRCDSHQDPLIATLRIAARRTAALPVRNAVAEDFGKHFHEFLKEMGAGRIGLVREVLRRQAGRWSADRRALVQSLTDLRAHIPQRSW